MMVYVVDVIERGVFSSYRTKWLVDVPEGRRPEEYCAEYVERKNKRLFEKFGGRVFNIFKGVIGIDERYAGIDKYGTFYNFSGNERKGFCFWCGTATKANCRYCCTEHQEEYLKHYHWFEASIFCWKRYKGICAECGAKKEDTPNKNLYVHHIVPVDGEDRNWHVLNMPKNLILLCMNCHMKYHKELNYLLKRAETEERLESGQLELWKGGLGGDKPSLLRG